MWTSSITLALSMDSFQIPRAKSAHSCIAEVILDPRQKHIDFCLENLIPVLAFIEGEIKKKRELHEDINIVCLLYTSPSPRDS